MSRHDRLDVPVFLLTWTTYGTWLPGDERGWVNAATSGPAEPVNKGDVTKLNQSRDRLRDEPVVLNVERRNVVERSIREVCKHRNWRLLAVNVRSKHVHVVVAAPEHTPERVMNALKSWSSRRLNESFPQLARRNWWTRHGSTRWINHEDDAQSAIHYVCHQQDGDRFANQEPRNATSRDRPGAQSSVRSLPYGRG
jgi:REP element-mobilizing transposase RayT